MDPSLSCRRKAGPGIPARDRPRPCPPQTKIRMHILKKLIVVFLVMALLAAGAFAWYYFYGPCGTLKAKAAINQTQASADAWLGAEQIAGSTSRIALPG